MAESTTPTARPGRPRREPAKKAPAPKKAPKKSKVRRELEAEGRRRLAERSKDATAAAKRASQEYLSAQEQVDYFTRRAAEEAQAGNRQAATWNRRQAADWKKKAASARTGSISARQKAPAPAPKLGPHSALSGQGPLLPGQGRVAGSYTGGSRPRGSSPPAGPAAPAAAPPATGGGGTGGGGQSVGPVGSTGVAAPTGALPAPGDVTNEALALGALPWMLNHPELGGLWREATANRWTKDVIRAKVLGTGWFREQGTANVVSQLRDLSNKWLVPLGDNALKDYAVKLATKEIQPANFDAYLREQAANAWPGLKDAISSGLAPTTYFEPYRQRAAEVLELNPEQVTLSDPRFRRALDYADPKTGERRVMSDTEWRETLRTDRSYNWRYTDQANKETYDAISFLAKRMGMAG